MGNPIDDCWHCDPNWVNNRKRLADYAIGFGKNAIGGKTGIFYIVTDPNDDDLVNPRPGTLRHAVIQTEPLWIIFQRDMVIQLKEELIMNSYKTIDGRGAIVHIANGACITIQCRNGYFHVVNNDYTHWEMYAIGGSANPTINSQGNRFLAPDYRFHKEVTKHQDSTEGNWRSVGDLMLNGAFFTASGAKESSSYAKASSMAARPSSIVGSITASSDVLTCRKGSSS
ncbi:hypothetical protein SUGI_0304250 [Cryptomeria japonica]|nr:hypothetical protein SUGI_0304250 [Cryptomeria japonica]